jgi:hypothetical protein
MTRPPNAKVRKIKVWANLAGCVFCPRRARDSHKLAKAFALHGYERATLLLPAKAKGKA